MKLRTIVLILSLAFALGIGLMAPAMSSTGCGKSVDALFNRASAAYSSGDWALTSANMQEAASDYAGCMRRARTANAHDRFTYFYGASLYVAGEAEAKLHHTRKVEEFWGASGVALRSVRNSKYLDDSQHLLVVHALTVINATLKALHA